MKVFVFLVPALLLSSLAAGHGLKLIYHFPCASPTIGLEGFQGRKEYYLAELKSCGTRIMVHAASNHQTINEIGIPSGCQSQMRLEWATKHAPVLVLTPDAAETALSFAHPLLDQTAQTSEIVLDPTAFHSSFTNRTSHYILYQEPAKDGFTRFVTIDPKKRTGKVFFESVTPPSPFHRWIKHEGKSYAVVHFGPNLAVIDPLQKKEMILLRPVPPFLNRFFHFQTLLSGEDRFLAIFDPFMTQGDTETIRILILDPFSKEILRVFDTELKQGSPGSGTQALQRMGAVEDSVFFLQDGLAHFVAPMIWSEKRDKIRHHFKQYHVYQEGVKQWDYVRFDWLDGPTAFEPNREDTAPLLRAIDGVKTNELQIFQGPKDRHYGLLVAFNGRVFLIDATTGNLISKTELPRQEGPSFESGELYLKKPVVYQTGKGKNSEFRFTGYTTNTLDPSQTRVYTVRIDFPE